MATPKLSLDQEVMQYLEDFLPRPDQYEIPYRAWVVAKPVALLVLSHGMAEHAQRYEGFADFLNEQNISVWALEHRGHGEHCPDEDLGHYADQQGWEKVVADLIAFRQFVAEQQPDVPVILYGHSMGSFITLASLMENAKGVSGVLLTGCGSHSRWSLKRDLFGIQLEKLRLGKRGLSKIIDHLSFSKFNKHFKPNRTPQDWLSRDPAEVDLYLQDPYCGFICTTQLWSDFVNGLVNINDIENVDKIPKHIPFGLFSGDEDPVGDFGKGVRNLANRLASVGVKDVGLKLYPGGRHEIVNETNRDEEWFDLRSWVLAHI